MDDRLKIIFARRSIRSYTSVSVVDSDVRSLLEAGMSAPSANDKKPWSFVVVRARSNLERLSSEHPYGKMLKGASLAIAVCGDPAISRWWVQDCSAATENILVAAAGLGLGAVWVGCHGYREREDVVRRCLNVPDSIGVLSLISIGQPGENKLPRTQFDLGKVHTERW